MLMGILIKVFKQTFWQIIGKLVTSVSTVIILGIVARSYGEEGTGVFTLVLTYLAMFYLLADFGFNAHVLTKVAGLGYRVQKEWRKLLGTRIVWSGILVVLAIGSLPFWPASPRANDFSKAILLGSLAIIGSAIFITCNLIFQSRLRYDLSVLATSIGTLISLGLFVYLSSQKYPIPLLFLAHVTGWIIIAVVSLTLARNFLPKLSPVYDYQYIKCLFKDSWPIAGTLALNVLYFRADTFMIAYFKGVSDTGIYSIAYSVFQSVLVLPTFIMNAYYPLMLKSLSKVRLVGISLLTLAAFGTVLIQVWSPYLINILTGGGFIGSTISLQILSLSFPAFFLSSFLMWLLIAKGKYKTMLFIYTSGLIFNLVLNFFYIPEYSFLAASWTTVISEYFILLMQILVLQGILLS